MRDVGWQRHMTMGAHQRMRLVAEGKAEQLAVFIRPAPEQGRAEAAVHCEKRARQRFLADLHVRHHFVARKHPLHQQLQPATAGLGAKQACLDHLRVVEHQEIAGRQQCRQLAEHPVYRLRSAPIQQPRATALGRRMLGNQRARQFEIEIAEGVGARGRCRGGHGWRESGGRRWIIVKACGLRPASLQVSACRLGLVSSTDSNGSRLRIVAHRQ